MKFFLIILSFFISFQNYFQSDKVYIRCNQVGYLPGELKNAVIFSENSVNDPKFFIINANTNKVELTGYIKPSGDSFSPYTYFYNADFSALDKPGEYYIKSAGNTSSRFWIGNRIYNDVVDSLMLFFKVQRCGPTAPILHNVCHLWDIARIEGEAGHRNIDATGGWHDAGDYLKFTSTTAYATYLLIFSFEFDKNKFGFDNDNNSVPDVLDEAKIGLDWLLRCNYKPDSLITRVQDHRDHSVKWRLPENDTLKYDRVGLTRITRSEAGIYAAVMALAARVWLKKFKSTDFSKACLKSALNLYKLKDNLPEDAEKDSIMYPDKNYFGKFELAAVELYNTTGDSAFLNEAVEYANKARADYWWSYGDINSLAHFRLAEHFPRFVRYIKENLISFSNRMRKSSFNEGADYSWGTTTTFLGISLQAILLNNLDKFQSEDSLIVFPRDFVLGRNLWGYSFIHNIGTNFPHHQHSQVGYFNGGYLPGALSGGPAPGRVLKEYRLFSKKDGTNLFNSDSVQFNDEFKDFISNEPTLVGNATALFVMGYFSDR